MCRWPLQSITNVGNLYFRDRCIKADRNPLELFRKDLHPNRILAHPNSEASFANAGRAGTGTLLLPRAALFRE